MAAGRQHCTGRRMEVSLRLSTGARMVVPVGLDATLRSLWASLTPAPALPCLFLFEGESLSAWLWGLILSVGSIAQEAACAQSPELASGRHVLALG